MGAEVSAQSYTREQRQRYREKVRQDLDVFERMLNTSSFEFDRPGEGEVAALLDSQLAALEEPGPDEGATIASIAAAPEEIAAHVIRELGVRDRGADGDEACGRDPGA